MLTVPFYPLIKIGTLRTLMENWINKVRHTPYRAKNEDQFFFNFFIHYLPTLLIGIEHQSYFSSFTPALHHFFVL